jgi:RNA polymerase sigma factor (sigma-70 family)
MESQALRSIVRRLRQVTAPSIGAMCSDAELVRAFGLRREPTAFEQIVRRHGPMVLGVCRRVLRESADADDAFQATFLVLVLKAASLNRPERLAGWLHQVAHRTSRKLRATRLRRSRNQVELADVPGESPADIVWRELRPIFDDELNRLPDKLRLPAVLCFLEGHSKGDAARSLGWPEGTLSGRLQQARERLRLRFAARGLTLSAGTLAVALFEAAGSVAVADSLLASTLQHAAIGSTASAAIRSLADGVTQAMFMTKIKVVAAAVLFTGMVGTGTGVVFVPGSGPGEIVAGEPAKDLQPKQAPVKRDIKTETVSPASDAKERKLKALRAQAERLGPLVEKGVYSRTEWDELQTEIQILAADLEKVPADLDRAMQRQELELLKERVAWEERMVKKGFLAESQAKKTRLEMQRAEAALAKLDSPKTADPRRAAMDALISKLQEIVERTKEGVRKGIVPEQELLNAEATLARYKFESAELAARPSAADPKKSDEQRAAYEKTVQKLEEIVNKTAEGVRKGIVPEQELLNSEATLARYKFELQELPYRLTAETPKVTAQMRAAMEAVVQKMEQIVEKTAEGVRKGIVPQQELFNAERSVLEYKFKLAALTDAANAEQKKDTKATLADRLKTDIDHKERELARAEVLFKQKAISQEEVRRLRIDLGQLKANAAEVAGDFDGAVKHSDGVVGEWEAILSMYRTIMERGATSRAELRAVEVAVAEARVAALQANVRKQLAQVVALREQELRDARALFDGKAISAEEVRTIERALTAARARLAEGR